MLEPILSPDELWPGGIPSAIRLHPDADLSENDDLREESKGWCQFVHVCMVYYQHQHIFFMDCQKINSNTIGGVVPKTDLNEEMQQRRTLIERWASADQTFRDSYHARAPLRQSAVDYPPHLLSEYPNAKKRFVCLALVDKYHQANLKQLIKTTILLYFHEEMSGIHPMENENSDFPQIPAILVDPSSTTTDLSGFDSYHELLINYYLHPADFRAVSMTRSGTVLFPNVTWQVFFVLDEKSLSEGRVVVINFKCNGQIHCHQHLRPMSLSPIMLIRNVRHWSLDELLGWDSTWGCPSMNEPLDIDQPVIAILDAKQRDRIWTSPSQYPPDYWARAVDFFAPGYLELEAEDREADYDLKNLNVNVIEDTYAFFWPPEQRDDELKRLIKAGVFRTLGDETRQCSLGKYTNL